MQITDDGIDFHITLTPDEGRILVNCMKATFRQGRSDGIAPTEYQTRLGATAEDVKAVIAALEVALPH